MTTLVVIAFITAALEIANEVLMPKARRKTVLRVAIILLGLLAVIVDLRRAHLESLRTAESGRVEAPHSGTPMATLTVLVGTNSVTLDLPDLRAGRVIEPFKVFAFSSLYDLPFRVRLSEEGPVVSATIRSWDGKEVVEMHDNEWAAPPGKNWDRNFDKHGFEVIDSYGVPVIQLELVDRSTLRLGGVFWETANSEGQVVIAGAKSMRSIDRPADVASLIAYADSACGVSRWFQYPSVTHLGERMR